MVSKMIGTILILIVCIIIFPVAVIGGVFGIVAGVLGAIFGAIMAVAGGIFGAFFGLFDWVFDDFFRWHGPFGFFGCHPFTLALIVVIIALAIRHKPRDK